MKEALRKRLYTNIINTYGEYVTNPKDLIGDKDPSLLFFIFGKLFRELLVDGYASISTNSIKKKKKFNSIIRKVGKHFLSNPQIILDKNELIGITQNDIEKASFDKEEKYIYIANHAFKDDILASILATRSHAYLFFASLPVMFNTIDGLLAWLNGVVLVNRKVTKSRKESVKKAVTVLENGASLLIFPEGVWNKTEELLVLPLWPGVYRIAKETGAKIVPIVHYIRDLVNDDKDNPIYTIIDDPIDITNMDEEEALQLLRDTMATWVYLMMEKYGQTTREELLKGKDANKYWEEELDKRVKTAGRYDFSIETTAHFIPRAQRELREIQTTICNISKITKQNAFVVAEMMHEKEIAKQKDYQSRF